jgi:hypothetical protein
MKDHFQNGVSPMVASAAETSGMAGPVDTIHPAWRPGTPALTRFVEINGFRFADLLFGRRGKSPLVFGRSLRRSFVRWNPDWLGSLTAEPDLSVILAAVVVSGFLELFRLMDRLFVGGGR